MRRAYYTVAEKLQAEPHTRRTTLERLAAFEKTYAALKNKPGLKRESRPNVFRRLLRWPAWVWRW